MGEYTYGTYVSQKINKVRWCPEENIANMFVSGSWDDYQDSIKVWSFSQNEPDEFDFTPKELCVIPVYNDITQMKFLNKHYLMASTSGGVLEMFSMNGESGKLSSVSKWGKLHNFGTEECSCTDFATFGDNVTTVGEDGRIRFIDVNDPKPLHTAGNTESCVIRCVSYYTENEVVTGNCRGQIKIWNSRSFSETPEISFMIPNSQVVGCNRIIHHPSQKHIILSGLEDGSVGIWDLRNTENLITLLEAHSKSVTELAFYPDRPEHLFSSSSSGELWHWDVTKACQQQLSNLQTFSTNTDISSSGCPWTSEDLKNKTNITALIQDFPFPINSFDLSKDTLICGCDNEAVYLIKNISA